MSSHTRYVPRTGEFALLPSVRPDYIDVLDDADDNDLRPALKTFSFPSGRILRYWELLSNLSLHRYYERADLDPRYPQSRQEMEGS